MSSLVLRTSRSLCSLATSAVLTSRLQQTNIPSAGGLHLVGNEIPIKSRDPLEPTRVDLYLASIHATGLEPTLDDIERCRPNSHASPESSKYGEEYANLLDTLCRSFSKDQLRKFTELYKLDPIWTRSSRRKVEFAESIIEKQWNWPSLKEIERRKRDRTEVVVRMFSVNPSQLFLILGKDGVDLLQLSMQYNVHISLASNPLALRVEGLRGSMKHLTEHLNGLKKGIIDEIVELPSKRPIRQDLVQRISRLAGAYVENLGHKGKIRICAKNPDKMITAKRLAIRASMELQGNFSSVLCYVPAEAKLEHSVLSHSSSDTYAIYPFLSFRSFPWTTMKGGCFRVRRVAHWLDATGTEDILKIGGLTGNQGRVVSKTEEPKDLKALLQNAPKAYGHERLLTASFGHIILGSPSLTGHTVLSPPLKGNWSSSKILKWLDASNTPLKFVPSLPATLDSSPFGRNILHRVVYCTHSEFRGESSSHQQLIKLELEFSLKSTRSKYGGSHRELAPDSLELGVNHNTSSLNSCQDSVKLEGSSLCAERVVPEMEMTMNIFKATCWEGIESTWNVMMPDCPMDIQFTVFDHANVCTGDQPLELVEYVDQLSQIISSPQREPIQFQPPTTFEFRGQTYILQTSVSVRKPMETTSLSADAGENSKQPISARLITENVLDLESKQNLTTCEVRLDDSASAGSEAWTQFFALCDHVSTVSIHASQGPKTRSSSYLS